MKWLDDPAVQRGVGAVNSLVRAKFGSSLADQLRAGLIGMTTDHYAKEFVVVIDPARTETAPLERALKAVSGALPARVEHGCHSAGELLEAKATIDARAWPLATQSSYVSGLKARDSTFHVAFDASDTQSAATLKAALGALVTIEFESIGREGRMNDSEPHWGGAGIRRPFDLEPGYNHNSCTSAFTAVMPNGAKGSITAGHCAGNDVPIFSGTQFYGNTDGRHDYPQFDMIRIRPHGETFERKIHTDPCCPVVRTVTRTDNPDIGELVCKSGMVTKAKCGLEVKDVSDTECDQVGCTPNLVRATKPGQHITADGDSGAPVYSRFGGDTAEIHGMHVIGNEFDKSWSHKQHAIKEHLNVSGLAI